MVAARQTTFDDRRKARFPRAAWVVYAYIRSGEICANDAMTEIDQCTQAFRDLVANEETLSQEIERTKQKLGLPATPGEKVAT